jgi:hypothetical protein
MSDDRAPPPDAPTHLPILRQRFLNQEKTKKRTSRSRRDYGTTRQGLDWRNLRAATKLAMLQSSLKYGRHWNSCELDSDLQPYIGNYIPPHTNTMQLKCTSVSYNNDHIRLYHYYPFIISSYVFIYVHICSTVTMSISMSDLHLSMMSFPCPHVLVANSQRARSEAISKRNSRLGCSEMP